jgi:hypothetical protein
VKRPTDAQQSPRLWILWIAFIASLITLRPISDSDFWWHMARGRAVMQGHLHCSAPLLTTETQSDADWLSGLTHFLLWSLGGYPLVCAGSVLFALLLLWQAGRHAMQQGHGLPILTGPLSLLLLRSGLQSAPGVADLLMMGLVWRMTSFQSRESKRRLILAILLCFWASLGERPLVGVLLLLFRPWMQRRGKQSPGVQISTLLTAGLAIAATCLNPRGILALRDSAWLMSADLHSAWRLSNQYCVAPEWMDSFLLNAWGPALLMVLGIVASIRLVRSRMHHSSPYTTLMAVWASSCGIPLVLVMLCRANIPIASLWLFCVCVSTPAAIASHSLQKVFSGLGGCLLLGVIFVDACGRGPLPSSRLGWGISHQLDPRLLELPGQVTDPPWTLWAADRRTAGISLWLNIPSRLIDHPRQAFLGGRLSGHLALTQDLLGEHRAGYRREDGTSGGWHLALKNLRVDALIVPAEMIPLNRSLFRSTWKVIDLDSANVPYVSAEDLRFGSTIFESIGQQGFVDAGPWRADVSMFSGFGNRTDLVEIAGLGSDPLPAIRQSGLFRSMGLSMAALRTLLPMRQQTGWLPSPRLLNEFLTCQQEAAWQEWIEFGGTSNFRALLMETESPTDRRKSDLPQWQQMPANIDQQTWEPVISLYRQGRLSDAIAAIRGNEAEHLYARGIMAMELGDLPTAAATFRSVVETGEHEAVLLAARFWLQQTTSFLNSEEGELP